jgi:predicted Zn-dependent protease
VIAHEIAHVAARHGIEQASKGQLANYASIPLIFLGGWGGYIVRQVAGLAVPLTFLKFTRGAEKEADRLGAQYLWAAGYNPHAMITFFEKVQAREKKKPGTMARVFSTHVGDRISEVRSLVARFPEKNEYELSSSDFKDIRARLLALSATQRAADSRSDRPTLKRRPTKTEDHEGEQSSPERPTLKRGEPVAESSEQPQATTERPTLKRQGETNVVP